MTAAVADAYGAREALAVAGGLLVVAAVVGAAAGSRERTVVPDAEDVRALRASPLVGWLPPIALARIASTVEPLELAAGAVLLREGDEGDRAYLVVRGEVAAERGGTVIERIGCGGVVGEIALLRRTTRTATVRATTDCRVLAIEHEEFLVAVGGNASAREAAGALVERRLARVTEA